MREKELTESINVYVRAHGYESSCFRPREHGDEISLMSEVVLFNREINLFPTENILQQELREIYEIIESEEGNDQTKKRKSTVLAK